MNVLKKNDEWSTQPIGGGLMHKLGIDLIMLSLSLYQEQRGALMELNT